MPIYNAPLEDMRFILNDVFKVEDFWKNPPKLVFYKDLVRVFLNPY